MFAKTTSNSDGFFSASHRAADDKRLPKGPVFYDSEDKLTVLFQTHGSVWPRVITHAIINTLLVVVLKIVERVYGEDITVSTLGHTIAGMLVSFLLVSRINSGLTRYNESRGYIGVMYQETREIVQKALVYSRSKKNADRQGKEWRSELAYRAMLLLQTTVANIRYPAQKVPAYDIPELSGVELQCATPDKDFMRRAKIPSTKESDSVRVPKRMAQLLRETVCSQGDRLSHPITVQQEMNLLASVDKFQSGIYGMRKFMTTPVPFPLVQMAHTLVMIYVFTLPLVFLGDSNSTFIEDCITTFMLTYGFIGLDATAVELDDPFGDDANDFDVAAYAQFAIDDIVIMIYDSDGQESADSLRYKMDSKPSSSRAAGENSGLLSYHDNLKYTGSESTDDSTV